MGAPLYGGFAPFWGQTLGFVLLPGMNHPLAILKLDWDGLHRGPDVEVTSLFVQPTEGTGLGNRQFVPHTFVDPGHLRLRCLHDPTEPVPMNYLPAVITMEIGPATNSSERFFARGYVTEFEIDGPLEGPLISNIVIKLTDTPGSFDSSGAVGWTSAN